MIVQSDLTELYGKDISSVYAGVVLDMRAEMRGHQTRIGRKRYFNNGMMLLNLKKMRKDNISEKLFADKLSDENTIFMTQDAFNRVFNTEVKFLSPLYNYMGPNLTDYTPSQIKSFFNLTDVEYKNLVECADIVHLANRLKPWNCAESWGTEVWLSYYRLSPLKNLPLSYKN